MKKKITASILISNYNKSKYLNKCINSCLDQNCKNYEIIIFDDCSSDNSYKILNKYKDKKNISVIFNKKRKSNFTSYNQTNSIIKCLNIARGKYIFLLDADDYFNKNKLNILIKNFKKKNYKFIFNNYYLINKNNFVKNEKKKILSKYWKNIYPTSCLAFEKNFLKKIIKNINFLKEKYPSVTFDLRAQIYIYNFANQGSIISNRLTYYRTNINNYSKNYFKYGNKWWIRRNEAFEFTKKIFDKYQKKFKFNADYIITKCILFIINKLFK